MGEKKIGEVVPGANGHMDSRTFLLRWGVDIPEEAILPEPPEAIHKELPVTAEYGKSVRSFEQTAQDLFQNHFDAVMVEFVQQLGASVLALEPSQIRERLRQGDEALKKFLWVLYLYWWVSPAMSEEDREESLKFLAKLSEDLPLRDEFRRVEDGGLKLEGIEKLIEEVKFEPPQVKYRLYDREKRIYVVVDREELTEERYPLERYILSEVVIRDTGEGYDPELLSVFFPSKGETPWNIGRFGEGAKVSALEAQRGAQRLSLLLCL